LVIPLWIDWFWVAFDNQQYSATQQKENCILCMAPFSSIKPISYHFVALAKFSAAMRQIGRFRGFLI
jgi:hypothetical protein